MDIVIKRADKSALEDIAALEKICFSDPWSEQMFKSAFDSDFSEIFIALDGDKLCGYICLYIIGGDESDPCGDCELANVAVAPEYRGQGIAKKLMSRMYESAKESYCSDIFLEVRQSNIAATGLYLSENFEIYGTRKNYYSAPREDAVLMKKGLL